MFVNIVYIFIVVHLIPSDFSFAEGLSKKSVKILNRVEIENQMYRIFWKLYKLSTAPVGKSVLTLLK